MSRAPKSSPHDPPHDVGTLWMMRRLTHSARCALLAWPGGWELRVLVDGDILCSERCARTDDTFALADRWKRRMLDQGWKQVVPNPAGSFDNRPNV
jgi:hypothetical protein